MRRSLAAVVCAGTAALVLAPAAPALAHPTDAQPPTLPLDVTYSKTDNLEHLGRFPEHAGTAGGRLSPDGTRFFLTDPRGVFAYDTTKPADPKLLGFLPLPQTTSNGVVTGAALAQEDVDTDGHLLLVDGVSGPAGARSSLHVVDVSDPAAMKVAGQVPELNDHTWTCVSKVEEDGAVDTCAYAFGRSGHVVDLSNPAEPRRLSTNWKTQLSYGGYVHDLTEVRPGLVMTAGASALLIDTRDPEDPVALTELGQRNRFPSLGYHSVEWPREGRDRFVLAGTEIAPGAVAGAPGNTAGSDCKGQDSVVETWDASAVLEGLELYYASDDPSVFEERTFTKVDTFDASGRGIFLDGKAAASQLYCAHWFEVQPSFEDGGVVAVAYYNRGTRFVRVADDGTMEEIAWLTPAEGYTGSPQWVTDDLVYVMDYRRGMEVLRLLPQEATRVVHNAADVIAPASSAAQLPALHLHGREVAAGAALLLLVCLVAVERVVRRRTALRTA